MRSEDADRLAHLRGCGEIANGHHIEFLIRVFDERTSELLTANNVEVERRRAAEAEADRRYGIIEAVYWARAKLPDPEQKELDLWRGPASESASSRLLSQRR